MKKPVKKQTKKPNPNLVQRKASDPKSSIWVTASAGTGKTKVLTDRVLRIMLEGSQPENILCMTFTNAGASVMKNRIREELENWATCSDTVLNTKLRKLTGTPPTVKARTRARQLFAEYLDTPGGMKIQTIHSFCQSLLKRFPVETGIPPYFDVLDEQSSSDMLRQAQANILQQVQDNPDTELARAVHHITPEVAEDEFISLISEITYRRGQLLNTFQKFGGFENGPAGTIEKLYEYMGIRKGLSGKDLRLSFSDEKGLNNNPADMKALYQASEILENSSTITDKKRGETLKYWLDSTPEEREEIFDEHQGIFLTAKLEPRKRLATKKSEAAIPALEKEMERMLDGLEIIRTNNVARGTESLLILSDAILNEYMDKKRAINALDYDDLIYRSLLFLEEDNGSAWALEKLDGDLHHILVDEAQDTNPDQWSIIAAITKEFFKPKPRASKKSPPIQKTNKTMFVVGDEKQSIFSFQRADPKEFKRRRELFEKQVTKAGGKWQHVKMEVTFRSSPAIMSTVDAVFKNEAASDGLSFEDKEQEIKHKPFRLGQSGIVEVAPVFKSKFMKPLPPWPLPIEREENYDPSVALADSISQQIKTWLDNGEKLKARGREISPSDIMILVRRRSGFVDNMVRSLKKYDIPVAGADRISLREQIAAMDLIVLGEFLQFPRDDLKLAVLLKSPLIGLNDKDIENLALNREGTLWEELRNKSQNTQKYKKVVDYLEQAIDNSKNKKPYDFYAEILMKSCPADKTSGLFAIYSRLGMEAEDAIVEFMNSIEQFEKNHTPSMQGFLSWINAGDATIKREIDNDSKNPKVRIMTIHSAKGLESPIVILPDTTTVPANNTRTRPKFLWPKDDRKVPLWVPRAELENKIFTKEREKIENERDQEYRRLLYVAMTRAEDRLYVHGYQNSKNRPENSWYDLIKTGIEENLAGNFEYTGEQNDILRYTSPQIARAKNDGVTPPKKQRKTGIPAWARNDAPKPLEPIKRFIPSMASLKKAIVSNDNDKKATAPSPLDEQNEATDKKTGIIVHNLLELLPSLPKEYKEEAAKHYLAKPAWNIPKTEQTRIYQQIDNIINDSEFGALFGENSRAEVSISGKINKDGEKHLMSGSIDRLVVGDKSVWIIDYKNSKYVPKTADDISEQYIIQMAAYREALSSIYPDKEIKCALLWTRKALIQPIPDISLDNACQKYKLGIKKVVTRPKRPTP